MLENSSLTVFEMLQNSSLLVFSMLHNSTLPVFVQLPTPHYQYLLSSPHHVTTDLPTAPIICYKAAELRLIEMGGKRVEGGEQPWVAGRQLPWEGGSEGGCEDPGVGGREGGRDLPALVARLEVLGAHSLHHSVIGR